MNKTLQNSSQYPWRLQVEASTESTSCQYSPDGLKKIVRAFICNSGHSRNNVTIQLAMCLVHMTTNCSCEDMISHPINYSNAPIGKGYGFEWQYKLAKFNRVFASGNKLNVRLRIASVLHNSDESSSILKNSQLIANFDNTQTVNNVSDKNVLSNYVSLINNDDADFVFTLESGLNIKVHKIILKVRFPYFSKMLAAANGQNHLLINGHSYETMMAVMMYVYSGHVEMTSVEHALQVIRAANDFELPTLAVQGNLYVTLNLRIENLFDVLMLADQFKYDQIKESCKEKLISAKRANPSKKLEQYDGYAKLVQYPNFHNLLTEILTAMFNVSI